MTDTCTRDLSETSRGPATTAGPAFYPDLRRGRPIYQHAAQCPGIHAGGEAPPSLRRSGLGLDVLAQDRERCATDRSGEVGVRPESPVPAVVPGKVGELLAHHTRRGAFQRVDEVADGDARRHVHEQVDMLGLPVYLDEIDPVRSTALPEDHLQAFQVATVKNPMAVLGHEDQVGVENKHAVSTLAQVGRCHRGQCYTLLLRFQ